MKTFCGIDPGLNGGMAFIGEIITVYKTPTIGDRDYDVQAMKDILVFHRPDFVMIEQQIALPGQGLTSTLQTGKGFGILIGMLSGMNIPYQIVGAKNWQSKLFTGVSAKLDTKEKSEIVAKRLFPQTDMRKSDRARVAHDGITDALCIAEYARRQHGSDVREPITGIPHLSLPDNPDVCIQCGAYIPKAEEYDCKKNTP